MIVLIINYNRLTLPSNLADWCARQGLTPIFIDNHSDYLPLLDYYDHCAYDVIRLQENYGHTVVWNRQLNLLDKVGITGRYIVTDSDLDLQGVPSDFLEILNIGLDKYTHIDKCGLSLEIRDLPDSTEGNFIRLKCEVRYWRRKRDNMFWDSPVDTTFALYREGVRHYSHKAVRSDRPYTAKHMPWYYTDLNLLPEDEQYYYQTADVRFSTGKKRILG